MPVSVGRLLNYEMNAQWRCSKESKLVVFRLLHTIEGLQRGRVRRLDHAVTRFLLLLCLWLCRA